MRLDGLFEFLSRVLETMWLSALWVGSVLLVVTAPAGTAALVEVARLRQCGELHGSVTRAFVRSAVARMGTSTAVLGLWLLAVAVLAVNFSVVSQLGAARVPVLLGLLGVAATLALFGAVLPAAIAAVGRFDGHDSGVHLRLTVRTAATAIAASPLSAANVVFASAVGAALVLAVPLAILIVPGVLAHVSVMGWRRCAERMDALALRRVAHLPA
ncbi:hypothetical protein [Ruania rhizosphaerae]|uniref:hypothetical protein n=1 Tax=Ruania rhizosphaerae TaxID=1840413 RepID=UPI001358C8A8|nr:hypothetical protein [Ruania rhizosphaerae]